MVSYRNDAAELQPGSGSVIFPNPVSPGFSGTVGISGLPQDAEVRITSPSGRLVWRTQANGGMASWNVRDLNGRRPPTGVYLVFARSEDGAETVVGKIAVIE